MGLPPELIPRQYFDNYYDEWDDYEPDDNDWLQTCKPAEIKSIVEAIIKGNIESLATEIERQLKAGKSLDVDDYMNRVPLTEACLIGWVEGVQLLLERGANPNFAEELSTPIFACCSQNATSKVAECASLLLKYGADPNVQNKRGMQPLMAACWANAETVVDVLLSCPKININAKEPYGKTALFFAEETGNASIVEKLLKAGIDPHVVAYDGTIAEDCRPEPKPDLNLEVDYCFTDLTSADDENLELVDRDNKLVEEYLSEVTGGFPSQVETLLGTKLHGATLFDILSFDDERLKKCGLKLSYHRRKIISSLRQSYLLPWSDSDIPSEALQSDLTLKAIGDITHGALGQLIYMQGELNNLKQTIPTRSSEQLQKLTLGQLVEFFVAQRNLRLALLKLKRELRNVEKFKRKADSKKSWISIVLDLAITAFAAPLRYMISKVRYATEFD